MLTRDEILNAMDIAESYWGEGEFYRNGMCAEFQRANGFCDGRYYIEVPSLLDSLGGTSYCINEHYWEKTPEGFAERKLMLAFMLTWLDAGDL